MNLREYLFRKRISQTRMAEQLGLSRAYFSRVVSGKVPSPAVAIKIEKATGGIVTRDEVLFPDQYPDQNLKH